MLGGRSTKAVVRALPLRCFKIWMEVVCSTSVSQNIGYWSYFIKITVSSANFAVSDYCPFGEIIPYTVSITLHFQLDMHETGLWYAILNRIIILRFSVACTQTIY